ncbi:MAG: hypothetical protein RI971_670, partial [Chloroflexota bacterium]
MRQGGCFGHEAGCSAGGEPLGTRLGRGAEMNKVILAGRMTKPVEMKSLPSGSKVAVG